MRIKRLLKGFILAYGTVQLINNHGEDFANWLEKQAEKLARKAGESYCVPVEHKLVFKRIFNSDCLNYGDTYYIAVGATDKCDLLVYAYDNGDDDRINFSKYDCYILVEE